MAIEQRNATRNQSTVDYSSKKIFIWDNHYFIGTFKNVTGAPVTLDAGQVICRASDGTLAPLAANLANAGQIVGISAYEGPLAIANNGTTEMNVCSKGTVESLYIELPAGKTLASVDTESGLMIRDILERVGLHLNEGTTEHTDFDN